MNAPHPEAELLYALTDAVHRAETVEDVYEPVLDALERGAGVERGAILLIAEDGEPELVTARGLSAKELTAISRTPAFIPDESADVDPLYFAVDDPRVVLGDTGLYACAVLPLIKRRRLLGMVVVYAERTRPVRFDGSRERLLRTVASQAALGIGRAQLRAELEDAYREAMEAVRVRDEFLSIAGHELRTPLTALLLNAQMLSRAAAESGNERMIDSTQKVIRNGRRLAALIDQLLDVSRAAAGRLVIDRAPMDLAELVREAVDRFGEQLAAAKCEIRVTTSAGASGRWDRTRLDQVIGNILGNAIKYGPGKPIDVRVAVEVGTAVLTVRDQGIGIAPEDQERIFDRFERGASARHYGGLGLGLWITRQIVERHGGNIRITSELGQGTELRVELPLGE